jgi:hypothetical protein
VCLTCHQRRLNMRRMRVMTDVNEQAPKILDLPTGLDATGMRQEFDGLGTAEVPADRYWASV